MGATPEPARGETSQVERGALEGTNQEKPWKGRGGEGMTGAKVLEWEQAQPPPL